MNSIWSTLRTKYTRIHRKKTTKHPFRKKEKTVRTAISINVMFPESEIHKSIVYKLVLLLCSHLVTPNAFLLLLMLFFPSLSCIYSTCVQNMGCVDGFSVTFVKHIFLPNKMATMWICQLNLLLLFVYDDDDRESIFTSTIVVYVLHMFMYCVLDVLIFMIQSFMVPQFMFAFIMYCGIVCPWNQNLMMYFMR